MREVRAPAAAHVQVLSVQIKMGIERGLAVIRILPDDEDAAGVARITHRLDDREGAPVASIVTSAPRPSVLLKHPTGARLHVVGLDIEGRGDSQLARRCESVLRRADT